MGNWNQGGRGGIGRGGRGRGGKSGYWSNYDSSFLMHKLINVYILKISTKPSLTQFQQMQRSLAHFWAQNILGKTALFIQNWW